MRTRTNIMILAGAMVALAVQPAEAAVPRTHSFEGSCAVVGVAKLTQPLTVLPSPNHVVFRAQGTCSGSLDGRRLPAGGAPVTLDASGDKLTGCTGTLVPRLAYAIHFSRTTAVRGTAEVTFAGRSSGAVVHGAASGLGSATGTVQGGRELLEDCAAGRLSRLGISLDLLTITPLVG